MSFQAKTPGVLAQQLKVQVVRAADTHLYAVDAGDVLVQVGEELAAVVCCIKHDNSATPTISSVAAADLIISDSTAGTAGGDACAIRVNGTAALDANDVLIIKYIVA
jgi:hypothetical protein